MGDNMKTFAERLRYVRGNLSREDFALAIGVHKNTIGRYERGQSEPELSITSQICLKFNVDPQWLVLGKGTPPVISGSESVLFYSKDGRRGYLLRERDCFDEVTEENTALLTQIVINLLKELALPLDEANAPALANLYYTEMKARLAHFAKELAKLATPKN